MNQNVSRRMIALGAIAVVIAAVYLMMRRPGVPDSRLRADQVVEKIYGLCMTGAHAQTAGYYLGGPETDGAMRQSICEKITEGRTIKGSYIMEAQATADGTTVKMRNFRNVETRTDGRIIEWRLIQRSGRWLVVEVV